MSSFKIVFMSGDGIGPEVVSQVKRCVDWLNDKGVMSFECEDALVGGASYDALGTPLSAEALDLARQADAVLFGAVGGDKWEDVDFDARPEAALLALRKELGLFANLRPAICYPALSDASSLKPELVRGLDILIVRELTGGVYFGEPRGIEQLADGQRRGVNTHVYTSTEIRRVAEVAFSLARQRQSRVTSSEKRNVMEAGRLWYEEVSALHQRDYSDIELSHMLADNCGMQLVRNPLQFDVIVTDNLFGDMLSDIASMLTGSLGMLPSASLGAVNASGSRNSLYEPVHGSAPDIAGRNLANPLAMFGSLSMAMRYSFDAPSVADALDAAISNVLDANVRTADIASAGSEVVGTAEMGTRMLEALASQLERA